MQPRTVGKIFSKRGLINQFVAQSLWIGPENCNERENNE